MYTQIAYKLFIVHHEHVAVLVVVEGHRHGHMQMLLCNMVLVVPIRSALIHGHFAAERQ